MHMAYMDFFKYLYFNGRKKIFSFYIFRMVGHKEEDSQPSTLGTGEEK